jgi:hypothetical protein
MKTWACSILTFLAFMAGCAPGYYEPRPAYPGVAATQEMTGMTFENPETSAQEEMRIWSEESGR